MGITMGGWTAKQGNVDDKALRELGIYINQTKEKDVASLNTPSPRNPVKPGIYTSEFLLVVAADVISVLDADKIWTMFSPTTSGIIAAVVTGAYALSRGWAKSGN